MNGGSGIGRSGTAPGGVRPSPAQDLLNRLRDAGAKVAADDGGRDLRCKAPAGVLTEALTAEIRQRKPALMTLLRAEAPVRRALQARYDQACKTQTDRYGGGEWVWADKALARIDEATTRCEGAIERADRAGFDAAIEEFAWRSTPIEVLLGHAGKGSDFRANLDGWIGCIREWVARGCDDGKAQDLVIEIGACTALDGQDLRVRVVGQPKGGEVSVEDLPGLMQAVEGGVRGADMVALMAGVATMRRSFGEGVKVEGFRRATT